MLTRVSKDLAILEYIDLAGYMLVFNFDEVIELAPIIRQLWSAIGPAMSVQVANQVNLVQAR